MRWWPGCFFILLFLSCHSPSATNRGNIIIRLSTDSQSVYISGLEYATLHDLKTDTLNNQALHSLFSVYRMPADTDLVDLQPQQPGKYRVTDTSIVFTPDTVFSKHQRYSVRYYGGPLADSRSEVLQSKAKLEGQHYKEVILSF
jgi:hypothetical protein